jgi:pimeloyl-ACP methyl ester carboxylesterase
MPQEPINPTRTLQRPGGRIAYDVTGQGPLVLCVPGMGDVRSSYRFLAPALVEAGHRVATMDLRGHGESDTSFSSYDDVAAGGDVIALIEALGGPAWVLGNSMGAAAAAWAAAEVPQLVSGLVLIGPFVREVPVGRVATLAFRLALLRPWGPAMWRMYHARLFPGRKPADLAEHSSRIRAAQSRPGGWKAFVATTRTSHAPVEPRLPGITAPTLVVMGDRDPDFKDPAAEAEVVAARLRGTAVMVPSSGHYPHVEYPEVVNPAVVGFLSREVAHA